MERDHGSRRPDTPMPRRRRDEEPPSISQWDQVDHTLFFTPVEPVEAGRVDRQALSRGTLILLGRGVSRHPCFSLGLDISGIGEAVLLDYRGIANQPCGPVLHCVERELCRGSTVILPITRAVVAHLDRVGICPNLTVVSDVAREHPDWEQVSIDLINELEADTPGLSEWISTNELFWLYTRIACMEKDASLARNWKVAMLQSYSFLDWVGNQGAIRVVEGISCIDGTMLVQSLVDPEV